LRCSRRLRRHVLGLKETNEVHQTFISARSFSCARRASLRTFTTSTSGFRGHRPRCWRYHVGYSALGWQGIRSIRPDNWAWCDGTVMRRFPMHREMGHQILAAFQCECSRVSTSGSQRVQRRQQCYPCKVRTRVMPRL
jgi:hypothetical protein